MKTLNSLTSLLTTEYPPRMEESDPILPAVVLGTPVGSYERSVFLGQKHRGEPPACHPDGKGYTRELIVPSLATAGGRKETVQAAHCAARIGSCTIESTRPSCSTEQPLSNCIESSGKSNEVIFTPSKGREEFYFGLRFWERGWGCAKLGEGA